MGIGVDGDGRDSAVATFRGHKIVAIPNFLGDCESEVAERCGMSRDRSMLLTMLGGIDDVDVVQMRREIAVLRLRPDQYAALQISRVGHEVLVSDLQGHIDAAAAAAAAAAAVVATAAAKDSKEPCDMTGRGDGDERLPKDAPELDRWYTKYHSYDEISQKLSELASANPAMVELHAAAGKSIEGRAIVGVRIGRGGPRSNATVVLAGAHAREWMAIATAVWAAARLAADPEMRDALAHQEVYVVPCYNPDGYEYSRSRDRMWRKNRRLNSDGTHGVDLNRNWDSQWGLYGASSRPRSDAYGGTAPFSEPEISTLLDWVSRTVRVSRISAFVDVHSYGQLVLRPYGWTTEDAPGEAQLRELGDRMAAAMRAASNGRAGYTSIKGAEFYPAGGCSDNYFHDVLGVARSFTIEVAGSDFVAPASDIAVHGESVYAAVRVLAKVASPRPWDSLSASPSSLQRR
jgi:hypothetical protein